MAVWLVRAGAHGAHEQIFLRESRVYVTWEELDVDLSPITDRKRLMDEMATCFPDAKSRAIASYAMTGAFLREGDEAGWQHRLAYEVEPTIALAESSGLRPSLTSRRDGEVAD